MLASRLAERLTAVIHRSLAEPRSSRALARHAFVALHPVVTWVILTVVLHWVAGDQEFSCSAKIKSGAQEAEVPRRTGSGNGPRFQKPVLLFLRLTALGRWYKMCSSRPWLAKAEGREAEHLRSRPPRPMKVEAGAETVNAKRPWVRDSAVIGRREC